MKSNKTKNKKQLLYEDFMADFLCVHFCPRRCQKSVKFEEGTRVKDSTEVL